MSDVQPRRKLVSTDDDDTEIVIVSDTVRQRRSRTPITPSSDSNRESNLVVMPDLLPDNNDKFENGTEVISLVSIHAETHTRDATVGQIIDTVSILESCNRLELQHVEMVNIIDVTSDSDTATSTPIMTRKSPHNNSIDELKTELKRELDTLTDVFEAPPARISLHKLEHDRDILRDSEMLEESVSMMKLRPSLKELLMQERGSFYSADKDNFDDEPLEFSDDEEIPRYSIEMDSDSDLVDRDLDIRVAFAIKLFKKCFSKDGKFHKI